jgi:hypothetical protein
MSTDLSNYMKAILTCKFPQFDLLTIDQFVRYLDEREVRVSKEELEYFEKTGIILPVVRLHRPKTSDRHQKYAGMSTDAYSMQRAFSDGLITLPTVNSYKPWKEYMDGYEETAFTFYHPFQIVPLHYLLGWTKISQTAGYILNEKDPIKSFERVKKHLETSIAAVQKAIPTWNKKVGVLMLLQEAYRPEVDGTFKLNLFEMDNHEKWIKWKNDEFSPKDILQKANMTVEEIKSLYEHLSAQAQMVDPIDRWYVLTKLISRDKKRQLKLKALLAQDYYDMAEIVACFLEDLGEKTIEPDDLMDGRVDLGKGEDMVNHLIIPNQR